jgi:rubredoxin
MPSKYVCSHCNLTVEVDKGSPNEDVGGLCAESIDFKHDWKDSRSYPEEIGIIKLVHLSEWKEQSVFSKQKGYRERASKFTEVQLRKEYQRNKARLAELTLDLPDLEVKQKWLRNYICKKRMGLRETDEALFEKWLAAETGFPERSPEIVELCAEDGKPIPLSGACPECGSLGAQGSLNSATTILKEEGFEVIHSKDWILLDFGRFLKRGF